jgi:hypothetical protein
MWSVEWKERHGVAMGSYFPPIVSIDYMENFEKLAFDSARYKPPLWLQCIDDTVVVWLRVS